MNISAPFIKRPVATSLLSAGLLLFGALAYPFLPLARLTGSRVPDDYGVCEFAGRQPGDHGYSRGYTAGANVRSHRRHRADDFQQSAREHETVTMQFDLNRNADAAGRDVQAAINAARGQLPANLPTNPNWRKTNPADSDFMNLAVDFRHGHHGATLTMLLNPSSHRSFYRFPAWAR